MMKTINIIVFLLLFPFAVAFSGQGAKVEKIRVVYQLLSLERKTQRTPATHWMQLSIGDNCSHFFEVAPPIDSTRMKPGVKYIFVPYWPTHIYKGTPNESQLTFTGEIHDRHFYYVDKVNFDWGIEDGDTVICGYQCQKASTVFRGRKWTVWYTLDIPCSDGPWKFRGLPGLVMKADDEKNQYSYTACEVSNGDGKPIGKVNVRGFRKLTRNEFLGEMTRYAQDPAAYQMEIPGGKGYVWDSQKGEYVLIAEEPFEFNLIEDLDD